MEKDITLPSAMEDLMKTMQDAQFETFFKDLVQKAVDNTSGWSTRESLSKQVKDVTLRRTPLWDMLQGAGEKVISSTHSWDAITSLATGISDYSGAIDSTGSDADPVYTRYSEDVKYYRTTTTVGQFTHAISRPELPAQQTVDQKAIQAIIQNLEADLFVGASGGTTLHGIRSIVSTYAPAANTTANAAALSATTNLDNLIAEVVKNGGIPTHMWMNSQDKLTFNGLFSSSVTYNMPQMNVKNEFGYVVQKYLSPFGEVDVMFDQFIPAKTGSPSASTIYITDLQALGLGNVKVNGTAGLGVQALARTAPKEYKLINIYTLLVYYAPHWMATLTDVR